MKTLSVQELADLLKTQTKDLPPKFVLLDVREPWEFSHCHIPGSILISLGQLPYQLDQLTEHGSSPAIVCICHHGHRSMQAAMFLEQQGFSSIFNLTGGVDAWARQIDFSMPIY